MSRPTERSSSKRRNTPARRRTRLSAERLEGRRLLAGDVGITIRGDDVLVRGDDEANQLEIIQTPDGRTIAVGSDGTTINGSTDTLVIAESGDVIDDLRIRLGDGDDVILIDGVTVADDLSIAAGRGDDAVGLLRTTVGDDLTVRGYRGELQFSLDLSEVGDDLRVSGGRDDALIVIDGSTVGDDTFLRTGRGDDTIVVRGSTHADDVYVFTGGGDDFIAVDDSTLGDDVFAFLGRGDDDLLVRDSNLADRVIAFAGGGDDNLELAGDNTLSDRRDPLLFGFDGDVVDDADDTIDAAVDALVDAGARRPTIIDIATGDENFSTLVDLIVQAGLLDALSGTEPLTVFAPTNAAFGDFIAEFGLTVNDDGTLDVPNDLLTEVLTFHVAAGSLDSTAVVAADSIETLSGGTIAVTTDDAGVTLDGRAGLVAVDVRARNGIVHVIDAVLTPPSLDLTAA